MRSILLAGVVAAVVLGTVQSSARASRLHESQAPSGLTRQGLLTWQLESLLKKTFGDRPVSMSGRDNFSCSGLCIPIATYSSYRFVFSHPTGTEFHISARSSRDMSFGNYPVPVMVRGHPIACDSKEKTFLIAFTDLAGLALDCQAPQK